MGLKPLTINTPAESAAHILAEDDAALYAGMLAQDSVLNLGSKLKATVISNNKVRIADGVVLVGGHAARIVKGDYEDMTINNGVSGQKRNDIIMARFIAGADGGADSYKLVALNVPTCRIVGITNDAASAPCTVTINVNEKEQGHVPVNGDGTFLKEVLLEEGVNIIRIKSTDRAGNYAEVVRNVTYNFDAPQVLGVKIEPNPVSAGKIFEITVNATD